MSITWAITALCELESVTDASVLMGEAEANECRMRNVAKVVCDLLFTGNLDGIKSQE